ncbi:MAG: hypothetical protein F4Y45_16820 [Acidobacteria bacterium]|nr:hypothetical protein [Acidobacteriota bacterium]MYJ05096.1 hypothetical protein [Acidobacteriota bacterium]
MSRVSRRKRQAQPSPHQIAASDRPATPGQGGFGLPLLLTLALAALCFVPRIREDELLTASFAGAAGLLLVWQGALALRLRRRAATAIPQADSSERAASSEPGGGKRGAAAGGGAPGVVTSLRPQHYVQAAVQLSVLLYWGYYWGPVYDHAWLLFGQLLFAYVFDMLLAWSRGERYALGFGPFPIIFSTNLFLWFRDDWFALQFLMIAVGFLGKAFVRWEREGRRVHIFNPSAFSLGLFSIALIATDATSITWGEEIATTLTLAPNIYLFLFLAGLVVMYAFSITLVAASAAIVLFGLSALWSATTGVPYFIDSEIPTAVFLGLHLLVTDPSTSPRTPIGKTIFGVLYGGCVFGLYALLGAFGVPTFYDKLLGVPLLNLGVRRIDALVTRIGSSAPLESAAVWLARPRANLTQMAVWIAFFFTMAALGATDSRHRGDTLPFWEQACAEERPQGCERLVQIQASYCADASAWACNELGRHYREGALVEANAELALGYFGRACELRFQPACLNLLAGDGRYRGPPKTLDLRLLLREGGANLMEMPEPELHARACEHGWTFACEGAR